MWALRSEHRSVGSPSLPSTYPLIPTTDHHDHQKHELPVESLDKLAILPLSTLPWLGGIIALCPVSEQVLEKLYGPPPGVEQPLGLSTLAMIQFFRLGWPLVPTQIVLHLRIDLHFLGKANIIGIIHNKVVLRHRCDQQGSDNAEKDGISDWSKGDQLSRSHGRQLTADKICGCKICQSQRYREKQF